MSDKSAIEWTEATLNPWTGCTKVSPGCANCYITRTMPFRVAGRDFDRHGHIPLVFHMDRLDKMVRRRKPTMYFVNSLSDLFHENASDEQIAQVFAAMSAAPQHTFQVLTKRPERMVDLLDTRRFQRLVENRRFRRNPYATLLTNVGWPLPNVWLGTSIENRRFAHRADLLRQTPAAVRFISAEPLLGPLVYDLPLGELDGGSDVWRDGYGGPELDLTGIDWLISGGESGPKARRFDPQWARDLRDACQREGVAYFHKQNGGYAAKSGGRLLDGREWNEMPARVLA